MTSTPFKSASQRGGAWLKPKDLVGDLAIVLEPQEIRKDVPGTDFDGNAVVRDVAVVDVAIFKDHADIEKQVPSVILKGANLDASVLVKIIQEEGWGKGDVALVTVIRPKRAYVWGSVTAEGAEEAAAAWYEARNAEVEANLADVPDFA